MSLAYSIGAESISIYHDGELFQVDKSHPNYSAVLEELRKPEGERDLALLKEMAEVPSFVAKLTMGRVQVGEDAVLFRGEPVSGYMTERLLKMAAAGDPIEPWAAFMDNLMDNPLPSLRDDLFKWMEKGKMPITPDGCIIAFKKVRADYTDVHTGKFSNAVGAVLEMDRSACDTNRHNTCSTGFHFCSADYLHNFGGERVMVVKINPRDVTAIPTDYNLTKARCCKYTVTGELTEQAAARHKVWSEKNVVNLEDPQELPDVMRPRGVPPSKLQADPARATGPAPVDDLAPKEPVQKKSAPVKKSRPKANSNGKKQAAAKDVAAQAPAAPELEFERAGQKFTGAQLAAEYEAKGRSKSALSKALGVPKTTLLGWLKKLGL